MRTSQQARQAAVEYLASRDPWDLEPTVLDENTQETAEGWLFFYQSARFVETRNPEDGLVGNAPVFVARTGESPVPISYHRAISESMEAYRVCGNPNGKPRAEVALRSWKRGASAVAGIQVLRRHAGIGLASSKAIIEKSLAGQEITVTTSTVAAARQLVQELAEQGFVSHVTYDA